MPKNPKHDPEQDPSTLPAFLAGMKDGRGNAEAPRPDVVTVRDSGLDGVSSAAGRAWEGLKNEVHTGLQDFVSRVLYGEKAPEPAKEHDHDRDDGMER